ELAASDEVCDALDNDCDGMVDEGDAICGDLQVCLAGSCTGDCFEGGCETGFTCTTEGLCIEDDCVDVTCDDGERCEAGDCVSPCAGITCPAGLECAAGRCVDLCEGATCDDCSVCEAGACIARCPMAGCDAGEACRFDGLCVEASCVDVTCEGGTHCEAGECVDSCEGAVCPAGEVCTAGVCGEPPPVPDGGVAPGVDAGPVLPGTDAGVRADGGPIPGLDGGPGGEEDGGCGAVPSAAVRRRCPHGSRSASPPSSGA